MSKRDKFVITVLVVVLAFSDPDVALKMLEVLMG